MISGRQVLATIEQVVAQARDEEGRLVADLQDATDRATRLRFERMEAFRELARLKLDPQTRDGVIGDIDVAERRAMELIESRRRTFAELTERRRAAAAAGQEAEVERHAKAAALEAALDAIGDLRSKVEAETRISGDWAAARAKVDETGAMAAKAETKAAQAEADRADKGKPYESDPLFMYLWGAKFGTADYRAGPLTRYFDRKVARLVGYDKARANYAILNEIPVRLREHAAHLKAEIEAARKRLEALERSALVAAGVEPLEERAVDAKAALDEAEARLAKERQALAEFDRRYDASALEGDAPHREAVELLAAADAQQAWQRLYREAVVTPSPHDEAILGRIEEIERDIGRTEKRIGELKQQVRALAARRDAIERERQEFRRRGYDRPYGRFGNENVLSSVLGGILGGMIQATVLRDVLQGGYRREPGPWDSGFGGPSFPFPTPPGGGPWGDAGGMGGGMGGGDGGGDGFDTGGSF
jgi:hypothetical protein